MTPSDWVAIGALIVAAITILFNYLIHKDNIRARREDLTKEKSIEAYRDLIEKFLLLKLSIIDKNLAQAIKARNECFYSVLEHRLYLPKTLHDDIGNVLRKFMKYIKNNNDDQVIIVEPEQWRQANAELNTIIERLQKHIGVETEEKLNEKQQNIVPLSGD